MEETVGQCPECGGRLYHGYKHTMTKCLDCSRVWSNKPYSPTHRLSPSKVERALKRLDPGEPHL